jgi:hypothetical protein
MRLRGQTAIESPVAAPPVPRAPGAWAALFAPAVVTWVLWPPAVLDASVLIVALANLLLAQHTAILMHRRHAPPDARWWLTLELLIAALCGSFLVIQCRRSNLLAVAALMTAAWAAASGLRRNATQRSTITGAGFASGWMLALSGPAACVVSNRGFAACLVLWVASAAVIVLGGFVLPLGLGETRADIACRHR